MVRQKHEIDVLAQTIQNLSLNPASLDYGVQLRSSSALILASDIAHEAATAFGPYPASLRPLRFCLDIPLFLLLAGSLYLAATGDQVCRLFILVALFTFGGIFVFHLGPTMRYMLPVFPFLFLAFARTLQWGSQRSWSAAAVLAVLLAGIYTAGFFGEVTVVRPRIWGALASTLKETSGADDVVIFYPNSEQLTFDYYARMYGLHLAEMGFPETIYTWWQHQPSKGVGVGLADRADLESMATLLERRPHLKTVWLVLCKSCDSHGLLVTRLAKLGSAREVRFIDTSALHELTPTFYKPVPPRLVAIEVNR